jgi:D-alanyl-D-alanine carboxypeptidase
VPWPRGLEKFPLLLRIFVCIVVSLVSLRAQLSDETAAAVDKLAAKALAESGTPAVSIAIIKDGKVALARAYGDAWLDPKTAATAGMRFSIGSVSKQFRAGAILLAAENGKLSLDDRVSKYLPNLTRSNDITIRQLLSHTAGYQDYYPQDYVPPFMREPVTAEGILDRWAIKPLDFEPGTAWQYSNTGFVIAGRVLEKAIGPLHPIIPEASGWLFAAGELAMTAGDLALWDAGLINASVLSHRSFEEMITPVRLKNGAPTSYALGIGVSDSNGHLRLSHGGAVSGFTSQNTIWPDLKLAVVVLSNKDGSTAPGRITRGLETLLLAPAQDPDAAKLLEQAKTILASLQEGRLDHSLFTANGNSYFTAAVINDYSASLNPLGRPKSFELLRSGLRGGFTERSYRIVFPEKTVNLVVRAAMDGRLEQYQISE